jgi:hypothetical protein
MGQFLGMGKRPPGSEQKGTGQAATNDNSEKQRIDDLLEGLLSRPLIDFGSARKDVHKLARGSVVEITKKIAAAAIAGNLPAAKYLFEMSGVYPVSEQGPGGIEEGSLAETLLKYLGLPTTLKSEDDAPATPPSGDAELETDPPTDGTEEDCAKDQEDEEHPDN